MVIKKIFDGNFDEEVHNDFLKFSRGEFKDRFFAAELSQDNLLSALIESPEVSMWFQVILM